MHQLETLLEATVDKTFDKFEIYTLRNILTVPDELAGWMRLGHYEVSGDDRRCYSFACIFAWYGSIIITLFITVHSFLLHTTIDTGNLGIPSALPNISL